MDKTKRLVIAIDCDDVIVEAIPAIVSWYNKVYGTNLQLADAYSKDLSIWGVKSDDEAIERVNKYLRSDDYMQLPPIKEAVEVLRWLGERHELHIVTGRADFLEEATRQWLLDHFGDIFKSLEFTNFIVSAEHQHKTRSKAEVCKQIGVDVLIDDHLHHAEKVAATGVQVILFGDLAWNQADTLPAGITRLADWTAIREYFDV